MTLGKLVSVVAPGGMSLALGWDDGVRATIDLASVIYGHRGLSALVDPDVFARATLSEDGWSVEWPGGMDFGSPQLRRWADEQAGRTMAAEAFRGWMDGHGLSLDTAAEALGLSRRTIAYYRSGEQPVPKTVMLATEGFAGRKAA
jgi:Protein of unknown function (DUF2442)